ncbi:MAG: methyltransferase domain-containing protein [Gemmatimonadetes bacterium]|nr:methyltransferase domain-containing protein [Gemmatimonadota bacterium]
MTCPHCVAAGELFGHRQAARDLRRFRKRGPSGSTRRLLDALSDEAVPGARVLDIGAGVGAVHLALLEDGAAHAHHVDASAAYQAVSAEEADRRNLRDRVTYVAGDYLDLAGDLPDSDVVCLDRVVCCYPDMPTLVSTSARAAGRLYGLVFPADRRWIRALIGVANLWMTVTRSAFRAYGHTEAGIRRAVEDAGLHQIHRSRVGIWQILVFRRDAQPSG